MYYTCVVLHNFWQGDITMRLTKQKGVSAIRTVIALDGRSTVLLVYASQLPLARL